MRWSRFIFLAMAIMLGSGCALYAFILVMDPYQNVPFSPDFDRAPIAQNQRYSYPALARGQRHDSAIIGTSMARLLKPERMDKLLMARFVNLAMNDATPLEQARMTQLFLHHHPAPGTIIISIDDSWCRLSTTQRVYTIRGFPEFMYDNNEWNDLLYLFNDKALENAVRMLEFLLGERPAKFGRDGYDDFTSDPADQEPSLVRQRIYGTSAGKPLPVGPIDLEPGHTLPTQSMAELAYLKPMLDSIPRGTRLVILFPPMHLWYIRNRGDIYRECKARVSEIVDRDKRAVVVDYLLDTPITRRDRNFIDKIHYIDEVAALIERGIADALRGIQHGDAWRLRSDQATQRGID